MLKTCLQVGIFIEAIKPHYLIQLNNFKLIIYVIVPNII